MVKSWWVRLEATVTLFSITYCLVPVTFTLYNVVNIDYGDDHISSIVFTLCNINTIRWLLLTKIATTENDTLWNSTSPCHLHLCIYTNILRESEKKKNNVRVQSAIAYRELPSSQAEPTTKVFVTWFAPFLFPIHFHLGICIKKHIQWLNLRDKLTEPFTENVKKTLAVPSRWRIINDMTTLYRYIYIPYLQQYF